MLVEQQIKVNGETLLLDRSGALWWPSERTLVCSDMHFEKGSSYARSGQFLPPYDTRTTLKRVLGLMDAYQPTRVISLGDAFHDPFAEERLDDHERAMLVAMGERAEWIWITGNHDPVPPAWLSGMIAEEVAIGALIFRHEPSEISVRGEVAGHLHPCKTVSRRGQSLRRRCFVSDGSRMVMPAFGAYAGGLDVRDDAVRTLFAARFLAYVLGRSRVFAVAA